MAPRWSDHGLRRTPWPAGATAGVPQARPKLVRALRQRHDSAHGVCRIWTFCIRSTNKQGSDKDVISYAAILSRLTRTTQVDAGNTSAVRATQPAAAPRLPTDSSRAGTGARVTTRRSAMPSPPLDPRPRRSHSEGICRPSPLYYPRRDSPGRDAPARVRRRRRPQRGPLAPAPSRPTGSAQTLSPPGEPAAVSASLRSA